MVGKVAKGAKGATPALAKEVAQAKPVNEFTPAKEVRPAKWPKGAKRLEPGTMVATEVNSIPATTTSSAVKGPTAADPARTKRVGKASKRGPATKAATQVPVAPTTKDTSPAKLTPPARGIPAAESEQGTQAAHRLGSRTGTGTGPARDQGLAGSVEDPGRVRWVFPQSWLGGVSGVPRSAREAIARNRGRHVKAGK